MSVFNNDIISREYYVDDVYDIRVENAVWDTLQQNFRWIFGDKLYIKYIFIDEYIHGVIDKMPLVEFQVLLKLFIEQKDYKKSQQRTLHRFLRRKLKVTRKSLEYSYFKTNEYGADYVIYLYNGYGVEYSTADYVKILIDKK